MIIQFQNYTQIFRSLNLLEMWTRATFKTNDPYFTRNNLIIFKDQNYNYNTLALMGNTILIIFLLLIENIGFKITY